MRFNSPLSPGCAPLLAGWLLFLAGCGGGEGPTRFAVSGEIQLDGQPLPRGTIQFISTAAEQGAMAAGRIENGKYAIPADQGPAVGKHKVRVYAEDESSFPLDDPRAHQSASDAARRAAGINSIDPQYNDQTRLEATITAAGPNQFSFNVARRQEAAPSKSRAPAARNLE